jgi:hypothetical protein
VNQNKYQWDWQEEEHSLFLGTCGALELAMAVVAVAADLVTVGREGEAKLAAAQKHLAAAAARRAFSAKCSEAMTAAALVALSVAAAASAAAVAEALANLAAFDVALAAARWSFSRLAVELVAGLAELGASLEPPPQMSPELLPLPAPPPPI